MIDEYDVAIEVNECLINVLGNCNKDMLERSLRRLMRKLGYVPTDGLPIEKTVVDQLGLPTKYKEI